MACCSGSHRIVNLFWIESEFGATRGRPQRQDPCLIQGSGPKGGRRIYSGSPNTKKRLRRKTASRSESRGRYCGVCFPGRRSVQPFVMNRFMLILAIVLSPLPSPGASARAAAEPSAERCCCCAAGKCRCGCQKPAEREPEQKAPDSPRHCACTDIHFAPPIPTVPFAYRLVHTGYLAVATESELGPRLTRQFSGHLAHGPPPALAPLSGIILII